MRITNFAVKFLVSASLLSAPLLARADTFTWSMVGAGFTGSGTITATAGSVAGAEDITGVSGSVNGVAVSQLVAGNYDPATPSQKLFADGAWIK